MSGFGTFVLDIGSLREGPTSAHGGGFGDWSGGDSHFVGRKNARYRFSIKGEGQPHDRWLTYEVRELNQCAGSAGGVEGEWAAIASTGLVSNTRVDANSTYGTVRRYDRLISDFKFNAAVGATAATAALLPLPKNERLEAGALFGFQDRVYSLVVFQVFQEPRDGPTATGREQKWELLRARRERLLGAIKIEPGEREMCQVINTAMNFSRNADSVAKAVACGINPYMSSWPGSCVRPRQ